MGIFMSQGITFGISCNFTGYLKKTGERPQEESIYLELAINLMRRSVPSTAIQSSHGSTKRYRKLILSPWFTAIEMDDCETLFLTSF